MLTAASGTRSTYVEFVAAYLGNCGASPLASCRDIFPGLEEAWRPSTSWFGQDVDAREAVSSLPAARGVPDPAGPLRAGRVGRRCRKETAVPAPNRARPRLAEHPWPPRRSTGPLMRTLAAAGLAGQRGASGHLSGPGRAVCAARVRRPPPLGHQDGRLPLDSPASGGAGTGRRRGSTVAESLFALVEPDAARHLDRRSPAAVRPAEGVRGPRAGDLHGRPGGMGLVVGHAARSSGRCPISATCSMLKHLRSAARRLDAVRISRSASAGNWPC